MWSWKDIFEIGIKFSDYESRKKLDSTASEDWGAIGYVMGARDQAITVNLWLIRSTVRNEWEVFVLYTPSACYETQYLDLRRKYTQQKQNGPKHFWIGPRIGWLIFSTMRGCW